MCEQIKEATSLIATNPCTPCTTFAVVSVQAAFQFEQPEWRAHIVTPKPEVLSTTFFRSMCSRTHQELLEVADGVVRVAFYPNLANGGKQQTGVIDRKGRRFHGAHPAHLFPQAIIADNLNLRQVIEASGGVANVLLKSQLSTHHFLYCREQRNSAVDSSNCGDCRTESGPKKSGLRTRMEEPTIIKGTDLRPSSTIARQA